jgi:predicted transcriptional regulator
MNMNVTNFDLLASIALFLVTFFIVMFLMRVKNGTNKRNKVRKNVIESILSEYSDRLENYKIMITEIRTKVDLLDIKINNITTNYNKDGVSDNIKIIDPLQKPEIKSSVISDVMTSDSDSDINNNQSHDDSDNTINIILKSLTETPQTARDIQQLIKKSREHTSRLLKKLYLQNLVSRDNKSTPFRYHITEEGHRRLHQL